MNAFSFGVIYGLKSISFNTNLSINKNVLIKKSESYSDEIHQFQTFDSIMTHVEEENKALEEYDQMKNHFIREENSKGVFLYHKELRQVNPLLFRQIKELIKKQL